MWKTIASKEIFKHPRLTLVEDEVELPTGVRTSYLKYKDSGEGAVTIIAKDSEGKILVSREYSYPSDQKLFQFVGGAVEAGESSEVGAARELAEEAGYKAKKLELLGSYLLNNRRSTKKMYVFLATELEEFSLPGDQEEDIENFWLTEEVIGQMIKDGEIINVNFLASWTLYKNK